MKDNEILDQPFDDENETSVSQSSSGINSKIIGFTRLVILIGVGVYSYRSIFEQGCVGPRPSLLENLFNLLLALVLMISSIYYFPQSIKEIKRHPRMFSKNNLRKVSLLLPILTLIGATIMGHYYFMAGVNPFVGNSLMIVLILLPAVLMIRDIHYIRLNKKV